MDYSSLTEAQAQHYLSQTQQQQQQQQQQQKPDQQQQQDASYQAYDPSQIQAYEAYYPYTQAYNPHQQYQQAYPYYPHDYGNSAAAANTYQQPGQTDPSAQHAVHAVAADGSQQNAYYPQDPQNPYQVPQGLNPAAAAAVQALSQLTQFAGRMDAAERAMVGIPDQQWPAQNGGYGQMPGQPPVQHGPVGVHPNVGRAPYRGGSRRGGGPSRGGRGGSGHDRRRSDGGAPPFRGKGRMSRGGGRRFPQHAPGSQPLPFEPVPYQETPSEDAPAAESIPAQVPAPALAQARKRKPPQVAWCDLCKVDCNTQEILEQHKSGKRHQKNLQKLEEFQKHQKLLMESQAKAAQKPQYMQGGEERNEAPSTEDLSKAAATAGENKMEVEQQNQTAEQSEVPTVEPSETPATKVKKDGGVDNRRSFPKRKQQPPPPPPKFGRGGKRLRQSEPVSKPEPPKEQPKYCNLCHVTCDTQAVFECHLAGKKHISRVKRSQGPQSTHRPVGLQAIYLPFAQPAQQASQGQKDTPKEDGQPAVEAGAGGQDAPPVDAVEAVYEAADGQVNPTVDGTVPELPNAIVGADHVEQGTGDVTMDPGHGDPSADHVPGLESST